MTIQTPFCSVEAEQSGVPLYGTAAQVETFFLLEYRQEWRAKAVKDNELPASVKQHLDDALASVPHARLLFIKRDKALTAGPLQLFVARVTETNQTIHHFELASHEDICQLDLAAIAANDPAYDAHLSATPLYAVCTNGKRDRCCAKFGLPLYQALVDTVPDAAWQTTHIGGHRYAATMIAFPTGVTYGYMSPEQVETMLAAHARDEFFMQRYRGRAVYADVVQAADFFLRSALDAAETGRFHHQQTTSLNETDYCIRFLDNNDGISHDVVVAREMLPDPVFASCDKPHKAGIAFRFLRHAVVSQAMAD